MAKKAPKKLCEEKGESCTRRVVAGAPKPLAATIDEQGVAWVAAGKGSPSRGCSRTAMQRLRSSAPRVASMHRSPTCACATCSPKRSSRAVDTPAPRRTSSMTRARSTRAQMSPRVTPVAQPVRTTRRGPRRCRASASRAVSRGPVRFRRDRLRRPSARRGPSSCRSRERAIALGSRTDRRAMERSAHAAARRDRGARLHTRRRAARRLGPRLHRRYVDRGIGRTRARLCRPRRRAHHSARSQTARRAR